MRRVLVLGSSFSAIPIVKRISELGYYVIVCGNIPGDPAHFFANESVYLDYSNVDKLSSYISSNNIDYLVPSCNDVAYKSGLHLACIFNFPGYDTLQTGSFFLEKDKFRTLCQEIQIPVPNFELVDDDQLETQVLSFPQPFLLKPTTGYGGIGILKIDSPEIAKVALNSLGLARASNNKFLVEAFVQGTLHSHSAFLRLGEIQSDYFVDEFCIINSFAVDSSNYPSRTTETTRNTVRLLIQNMAKRLELVDGLIHTQFIVSNGKVFIIESMRRCPGDLFPFLIEFASEFQYYDNYFYPFLGLPFSMSRNNSQVRSMARFSLAGKEHANFQGFQVSQFIKNFSFFPLSTCGAELEPYPFGKFGILFVEMDNLGELFKITPTFQELVEFHN